MIGIGGCLSGQIGIVQPPVVRISRNAPVTRARARIVRVDLRSVQGDQPDLSLDALVPNQAQDLSVGDGHGRIIWEDYFQLLLLEGVLLQYFWIA